MDRKSYLIWGYYGHGNLGDDLMLKCIVNFILNKDHTAQVFVRCFNRPEVKGIIPFTIEKNDSNCFYKSKLLKVYKIFKIVSRIDTFIIGGGTLFLDKGKHNVSMMTLAIAVFFAKLMKKRVFVIGAGIDILTCPANLFYLKYILKNSNFVALRDDFSYTMATYLVPQNIIHRSSDILFQKDFINSIRNLSIDNKKYIIISLTDYYGTLGFPQKSQLLIERAYNLITMILEKYHEKYTVVLCALQKDIGDKDYIFLESLRNKLIEGDKELSSKISLCYLVSDEQIREIFRSAVLTIAMRYHALVLSAIFKKPFWGINIETKIKEFCIEMNMPFINIDDFLRKSFSLQEIDCLTSASISDRDLQRQITLSLNNFKWINGLFIPNEA